MSLIFRTVHGSRLYGTDHADSDNDVFEVYEDDLPNLHHSTDGTLDVTSGGISTVLFRAMEGSHQSVEALFSPVKEWAPGMEDRWGPIIKGVRVLGDAKQKYGRTIHKFSNSESVKMRRHSVRLAINLYDLERFDGVFNPQMSNLDVQASELLANQYQGDKLLEAVAEFIANTAIQRRVDPGMNWS